MLIIKAKSGAGIRSPYNWEGIFDFGKILLKTTLPGLVKTASRAINSNFGQIAICTVKRAAKSELGQESKKRAISEVEMRDLPEKAFEKNPFS